MNFKQGDRVVVDHDNGRKGMVLNHYEGKMYNVRLFGEGGYTVGEICVDASYLTFNPSP